MRRVSAPEFGIWVRAKYWTGGPHRAMCVHERLCETMECVYMKLCIACVDHGVCEYEIMESVCMKEALYVITL